MGIMTLITNGFDTGKHILHWGTTLAEALTQLAKVASVESDDHSVRFPATRALGLDILSVTLRAPAMDRPVMQAWYELKHDPKRASDDDLVKRVSGVLGPLAKRTDHDMLGHPNPAFGVRCSVRWPFAGFDVGMSIYGASREEPEGLSPAVLYTDWEDEIAAAAPYLHEMEEAERLLESQAWKAEIIGRESLEEDQHRYHHPNYNADNPHQALTNEMLLRAQRCLRKRHLYQTPTMIAAYMRANQVVVWKNSDDQVWCISTQYETVCFPLKTLTTISHVKVLPARGPGGSYLTASDLDLQSIANSPGISRLVALLEKNKLAKISFTEEYNT
jgi:hypothetical protein